MDGLFSALFNVFPRCESAPDCGGIDAGSRRKRGSIEGWIEDFEITQRIEKSLFIQDNPLSSS